MLKCLGGITGFKDKTVVFLYFVVSSEMSLFPSIFVSFYLFTERTSYIFPFRVVFFRFFYLVTTGWIFDISSCIVV